MDKLSLYEILSYLVPGFIATKLLDYFYVEVFCQVSLITNETSNLEESFLLFILALFFGILTQILTFKFLNWKWIKKLVFKSPQQISIENDFVQRAIPFLNSEYKRLRKHEEKEPKPNEADAYLFDFAYLYLEVNDKVTPAKNFQSLYFAFRNVFSLCLITIVATGLTMLFSLFIDFDCNNTKLKTLLIITLMITPLIIIGARWLREKLVKKVFWSYYVELIHKNENN